MRGSINDRTGESDGRSGASEEHRGAWEGYLDAATAAPTHRVARQALLAALDDGWADPGRLYAQARRAAQLLDAARAATAEALGVRADEVRFYPSGSAAARSAVLGAAPGPWRGRTPAPTRVVRSAIEHSAVVTAAAELAELTGGAEPIVVPVDRLGRVDADALATAVSVPGVALAALISGSHEVGTLQPVARAAEICAAARVPLLVDAAQSVGRLPVPPGWSLLTASARKWGGPAGVGVLVVRKGTRWYGEPNDQRSLHLPSVVAAAASLRAVLAQAPAEAERVSRLVDRIRHGVAATVPDVEVLGDPEGRLPHIVTFSCLYVSGEALAQALDQRGFAVSSGSACAAPGRDRPSHVLTAMGALTQGSVRVSLHAGVDEADVDRFLAALPEVVARLRREAGVDGL